MEPVAFSGFVDILTASGPYGLVTVLGWAFWRVNEKKDRELKDLSQQVISMASAQTEAIVKIETAIVALRIAIDDLRHARK